MPKALVQTVDFFSPMVDDSYTFDAAVPENIRDVCFDPQTSGGLLFSVPASEAGALVETLKKHGALPAAIVGRIKSAGEGAIHIRS